MTKNNPVIRTTDVWALLLFLMPCLVWSQSNRAIEERLDRDDPDNFLNSYNLDTNFYDLSFYLRNILDINEDPIQKPEAVFGSETNHTGLNFFMYNPSVPIPQIIFNGVPQGPPFWKQPLIDWYKINPDGSSGQFGTDYFVAGECSYIPALQDQNEMYGFLCFNPAEVYDAQFPQKFYGNNGGLYSFAEDQVGIGFDFSYAWEGFKDLNAFYLPAVGRIPLQVFKRMPNSVSVTSNHLNINDTLGYNRLESVMPEMHFFKGYSEYNEFLVTHYGLDTANGDQYQDMQKNYNGMGSSMLSKYSILPVPAKTPVTVSLDANYDEVLLIALDTMMSEEGLLANSTRISGELGYWNISGEKTAFSWYQLNLADENGVQTFYEDYPFLLLLSSEIDTTRFDNYNNEAPYGVTAFLGGDMGMSNPLAQNPFPLMEGVAVTPFVTTIYNMPHCIPLECKNPERMHGTIGVEMDANDLRMYYLATDFAAEQLLEEDGYYSTYIRPAGKGDNGEVYNLYRMDGRWDTINGSPVQDPFLADELVYFDLTDFGPWPLIDSAALDVNHRTRRSPVGSITAEVKGTNFQLKELKQGEKFYYHNITQLYNTNLQTHGLTNSDFTSLSKAGGLLKVFTTPGQKFYAIASAQSQFSVNDQAQYGSDDWVVTQKEPLFQARDNDGHTKDFYLYEIFCHRESYVLKMQPDGPMVIGNDVQVLGPQKNSVNSFMYDKANGGVDYIVCAHRGFWRDPGVPENNIPAFNASLSLGAPNVRDGVQNINMIELDVKITKDQVLVLFHDDQLWRLSSLMDNVNLQPSDLQNLEGTLITKINWNNPATKMAIQKSDGSGNIYVTLPPLKNARPKDRFGNVVDISMMSLEEALLFLKEKNIMIALDKITGQITRVFEAALRTDTEDLILLKGNAGSYHPDKLQKSFGIVMDQIFYTPYLFSETTYTNNEGNVRDSYQTVQDFIEKDSWNIPGFEIQLKTDASHAPDYKQEMNRALRGWIAENKNKYWVGITSVTPSNIDKVDVKQLYDNCTPEDMADPASSKASSCSNYDWRADWQFCLEYVRANYYITDRPELTLKILQKYTSIQ
ncbi:MAG TPA: hypothetical protein DIU20_11680 [Cryomorphaceae bacterium]|nr:hypothetical protein [Cryomorphaceae bacterium]